MDKKESSARWSRAEEPMTLDTKSVKPWHGYDNILKAKRQAKRLAAIYYRAGVERAPVYNRKAQRVYMCHSTVAVQAGKIVSCWHCEDRMCPICSAKASRRIAANARLVIERARSEANLRPYMLTLTQKNCDGANLSDRISDMLQAWRSIMHDLKGQKKYVQGYARTVEITISKDGSYHPHVHALLLMSADTPREMLRARYWARLWQAYMRTQRYQGDVVPICDIRAIRPNRRKGLTDTSAAAAEVAKYISKSSAILSRKDAYEHILNIDAAISGRKLRSYGGVWRRIRADMKLEDNIAATEPPAQYLADMPVAIWVWADMTETYTRIV